MTNNFTTEYLIMNESSIDWEKLSADKSRSFSLSEIRMFRKRIDWLVYLANHQLNQNELEVASKYFTPAVYNLLAILGVDDEKFILNHRHDFNWELLISNSYLSEDVLNKCIDEWKDIPKNRLVKEFMNNKRINIYDGSYDSILLFLERKS